MNKKISYITIFLFVATLALIGIGTIWVYSSSFALAQTKFGESDYFLIRQLIRTGIALVFFMIFINVDYHIWGKISSYFYIITISLLIFILVSPTTSAVNGAKRWVSFGIIRFQVSELALFVMVIFLAYQLSKAGEEIREWKKLINFLIKIGIISLLIAFQPNYSTAFIVGLIGFSMIFVAGARLSHLIAIFLSILPLVVIGAFGAGYRRQRILAYLNFSEHKSGIGYQLYQSLIGLGKGGVFGVGIGHGEQKYLFLPEPHTDFVFSILGEEIGFLGLMIIILLFSLIIYCGIKIAFSAPDKFGQYIAFGFTFVLAIYTLIHAAVNVGLIPTTGIPMPFLSYGGMSLIFNISSMGILLNISNQTVNKDFNIAYKKSYLTKSKILGRKNAY